MCNGRIVKEIRRVKQRERKRERERELSANVYINISVIHERCHTCKLRVSWKNPLRKTSKSSIKYILQIDKYYYTTTLQELQVVETYVMYSQHTYMFLFSRKNVESLRIATQVEKVLNTV